MNFKFIPTQRNILSVAVQRRERFVGHPAKVYSSAAQTLEPRLIAEGFVHEAKEKNARPIWGHDKESDHYYALKLTQKA